MKLVFLTFFSITLLSSQSASAITVQKLKTKNGIHFWLVEDHTLPIIAMNFGFDGGTTQDPKDKGGLVNLMASLLDEGSGDLNSQAFQQRLEELAIKLSFSASRDYFSGNFRTLSTHKEQAFALLKMAVTSPHFDAEPVDRMRAQINSSIRHQERDPDYLVSNAWQKAAFKGHPYGRESNGSTESLEKIIPIDLKIIHRNIFAQDNLHIVLVGDIDAKTATKYVTSVFKDLPRKASLLPIADVVPNFTQTQYTNLAIPQTVIQFGLPGLKRHDSDFIPAYILNHILGGGAFSSRLYKEIREERGLVYSVYSYLSPLKHSALYIGGAATREKSVDEALGLIREAIERIAQEGPTAKELKEAKQYLIGSYPLRFDTSSKIGSILLSMQLQDISSDYLQTRNKIIEQVTLDQVKKVAKKLFASQTLLVSLVGKKETTK